jgi:hypothetical protein
MSVLCGKGYSNDPALPVATRHYSSRQFVTNRSKALDNHLLTETEVADFLGKSIITLGRWRRTGYGPQAVRVGRSPRYTHESLAAFMQASGIRPGGGGTTAA